MMQIQNTMLALGAACMLWISGCGNMVAVKHTVNGREVTTWTDPENAKKIQDQEDAKAAHAEAYRQAEKRKPGDPVRVALFPFTVAENLKKSLDEKKLFQIFRTEFEKDSVIRLVDQRVVNQAWEETRTARGLHRGEQPRVDADLSVYPHVLADQAVGLSRSSGKLAAVPVLVLKAEVVSHYLPEDNTSLEDKEHILKSVQGAKRLAGTLKKLIKTQLGPNLPSLAFLERQKQNRKDAFMQELKKAIGGGK